MAIKQEKSEPNPLQTLKQFERMMELIKQFPLKDNVVHLKPSRWELYPKTTGMLPSRKDPA